KPGAHPCEYAEPPGLAHRLAAHAVEVVHEVHDQRKPSAMGLIPKHFELVHRGKTERLPSRTAARGRVADIADDDARLVVDLLEKGCPDRDVRRAAHDRVVWIDAE